jgi:NAD(P)-dependent dehydrogenase (short-subunit alcohol dehydrogenase family)
VRFFSDQYLMSTLADKTLFITGASRGIGKAIALRAARDGANVVIAAKTTERHARLPGTIYTAAEEVQSAGGRALPIAVDVRFEEQVALAVEKTVDTFGGIDILINNVCRQCACHLCMHANLRTASAASAKPACPQSGAAVEHGAPMVQGSSRVLDVQVWDEYVRAWNGGRVP